MEDSKIIQVGPGVEALPPKGHKRRETLKKRTAKLDVIAEQMMNATDAQTYSVDPAKLKEEPDILRHFDFVNHMFTVTKAQNGKYVYFWCRDDQNSIALKQAEARMWLGAQARGWEIIGNCSCKDGKHDSSCPYPESQELKGVDGCRRIGDTLLMRIDLDEYTRIQKRIMVVQRYREMNAPEPLADFVRRHEGLVSVVSGNAEPTELYARQFNGRLVRTQPDERGRGITKGY